MLKKVTIELFEAVNEKTASIETQKLIEDLLEENDLTDSNKVPLWFLKWMECIVNKTPIIRTSYQHDVSKGDVSNFIAELEVLIEADWNDYGEAVEVSFPNLGMYACVSTEGNFYEVSNIQSM